MIDCDQLLKTDRLPSLPHVVARLLRPGPDQGADRAADLIVRADPAATARVLRTANTTYFGRKWPVMSVDQATPLVGATVVRSLTLMLSLRPESLPAGAAGAAYHQYWRESVAQASAAGILGAALPAESQADLYFAGLMLDIGRLAFLAAAPDEYAAVMDRARTTGSPLAVVERERLGIDHPELSARMMEHWSLPAALVEGTRRHHETPGRKDVQDGTLMAALAAAAAIGEALRQGFADDARQRLAQVFEQCAGAWDLDPEQAVARTQARIAELDAQFPWQPEEPLSLAELYGAANAELAELVVSESIATTQAEARADAARQHARQVERRIEELEQQALRDPLTRIYNRQFFEEALSQESARCCRHSLPIGLLFIDVDRFKQINDTWGHAFGDRVLKQVAHTIDETVRANDVLSRFGGEEFVVLPGHPTETGLARLAERIRTAVEACEHTVDDQPIRMTVSIGYTLALPARHETDLPARLVAAADAAMYEAKHQGRNRTSFQSLMNEKDRQFMRRLVECCFSRWLIRRGALGATAVHNVLLDYQSERLPIGRLAVREGLLSDAAVTRIVREQQPDRERFGAAAVRLGLLSEEQLLWLMALQREDPTQIARIAFEQGLLDESQAASLVHDYLAELRNAGAEEAETAPAEPATCLVAE